MIGPPRRLAAALTGVGVVLCVLGWYQASGQPTVAQQIPYLASATIPGAALLAAGAAALLRAGGGGPGSAGRAGNGAAAGAGAARSGRFLRVPDGRYLHEADCPLMDGRPDAVALSEAEARAEVTAAGLLPCPLCRAEVDRADPDTGPDSGTSPDAGRG